MFNQSKAGSCFGEVLKPPRKNKGGHTNHLFIEEVTSLGGRLALPGDLDASKNLGKYLGVDPSP